MQQSTPSFIPIKTLVLTAALAAVPTVGNTNVFDVNSTTDAIDSNIGDGICAASSGDCTLRAAIQEANGLAGADTINLPAGNYLLTVQNTDENAAADGDLDITSDVSIVGADRDTTIIDADYTNRIFHILGAPTGERPYTVSISSVQIINGSEAGVSGGGIRNFGVLTLQDVLLADNQVTGAGTDGGGLASYNKTTIIASEIRNNSAIDEGGGLYVETSKLLSITDTAIKLNSAYEGGGLFTYGATVVFHKSSLEENTASYRGGGAYFMKNNYSQTPPVEFTDSLVDKNTSNGGGGSAGIYVGTGNFTARNSTFTNNSANDGSGGAISGSGLHIYNSAFSQNTALGYYDRGGAIATSYSSIYASTFTNNSSYFGGALNATNSSIVSSAFSGNTATASGGAAVLSTSTIYHSLVHNNTAKYGGGIYAEDSTAVETTTVSGNTASSHGGGIYIGNYEKNVTISNSTITNNDASVGGSNFWNNSSYTPVAAIKNVIFSSPVSGQNCGGQAVNSKGSNIDSDGSCGLTTSKDQNNVDPLLEALADNGGPTQTHALEAGSPAIDNGSASGCLDTDQRVFARDANCDIGAFEFGASSPIAAGEVAYEQASFNASEDAGTATLVVTRTGGSAGAVSVDYYQPAGGSASRHSDYTPVAGTLYWADGETDSKSIEITLKNDSLEEGPETILLSLRSLFGGVTAGANASAVLNLIDDDVQPGELSFSTTDYSVNEDAGTITLTVNRDNGSFGETSVEVVTGNQNDTATVTEDYTSKSEVVTFADGETSQTVTITILDDNIAEGDEFFAVSLQNATNGATISSGSTHVTIEDNEVVAIPAKLAFELSSYVVNEPDGTVQLTVLRTENSSGEVSVNYATSSDSADGNDFTASSGTLTFADGVNEQTIDIAVTNDSADENDETFTVTLSNASSGVEFGNITTATVTIKDDDNPTVQIDEIQFQQATYTVDESAGTVQLTIVRSGNNGGEVSVDYATTTGTADGADFTAKSGTLTFASGVNTQTIDIAVTNDSTEESDETFTVTLSSASSGAELGSQQAATVTIKDDDNPVSSQPGVVKFSTTEYSVSEGSASVVLTLKRENGTDGSVSISYETASKGQSTAGTDDFTVKNGTITFADGESEKTISFEITQDDLVEGDEFFKVYLKDPTNGLTLDASNDTATVTIQDDDSANDPNDDDSGGGGGAASPWLLSLLTAMVLLGARRRRT